MRNDLRTHSDLALPRYAQMRFNNPLNGLFRLSPFSDELSLPAIAEAASGPALDVDEDETGYEISLEVPGMGREDLEVRTEGRDLILRGEKRRHSEETRRSRWSERRYGRFERTLTLPADADVDGLEARFGDGVLHVRIPRRENAGGRAVEIR